MKNFSLKHDFLFKDNHLFCANPLAAKDTNHYYGCYVMVVELQAYEMSGTDSAGFVFIHEDSVNETIQGFIDYCDGYTTSFDEIVADVYVKNEVTKEMIDFAHAMQEQGYLVIHRNLFKSWLLATTASGAQKIYDAVKAEFDGKYKAVVDETKKGEHNDLASSHIYWLYAMLGEATSNYNEAQNTL